MLKYDFVGREETQEERENLARKTYPKIRWTDDYDFEIREQVRLKTNSNFSLKQEHTLFKDQGLQQHSFK